MDILTAADVRSVAFTGRRKGYDEGEVDAFVDHVCESIGEYTTQIEQLRADLSAVHAVANDTQSSIDQLRAEKDELGRAAESAAAERDLANAELEAVRAELIEAKAAAEAAAEKASQAQGAADAAAGEVAALQAQISDLRAQAESAPKTGASESVALLAAAQSTADSLLAQAHADTEQMRADMAAERENAVAEEQARTRAALARIEELRAHELAFRDEVTALLTHLAEAVENGPVAGVEDIVEEFRVHSTDTDASNSDDGEVVVSETSTEDGVFTLADVVEDADVIVEDADTVTDVPDLVTDTYGGGATFMVDWDGNTDQS